MAESCCFLSDDPSHPPSLKDFIEMGGETGNNLFYLIPYSPKSTDLKSQECDVFVLCFYHGSCPEVVGLWSHGLNRRGLRGKQGMQGGWVRGHSPSHDTNTNLIYFSTQFYDAVSVINPILQVMI